MGSGCQAVIVCLMALRMVSSLRMEATRATFLACQQSALSVSEAFGTFRGVPSLLRKLNTPNPIIVSVLAPVLYDLACEVLLG